MIFVCHSLASCSLNDEKKQTKTAQSLSIKRIIGKDSVLSNDHQYYQDSVYIENKHLIKFLFKKYDIDTCIPLIYNKRYLGDSFKGFKNLGDINNDYKNDSVFVMPPLNMCEYDDGQSYYFTDTILPRIKSESNCCSHELFFKSADIDEDGICEVGFYYSSCTSRYKSLKLYRLKNKHWEQIATADFDVRTQNPDKIEFEGLVRKISKNKLIIRNFLDGEKFWDTVLIKDILSDQGSPQDN